MTTDIPANVDEYIAGFPKETQIVLEQVRAAVKKAAPDAEEKISYAMPAFTIHKVPLVYFAAFKNHIGFYSVPLKNEAFKEEFSLYKTGRGSVQFPLNKPMPVSLITRIVEFRINENSERVKKKM